MISGAAMHTAYGNQGKAWSLPTPAPLPQQSSSQLSSSNLKPDSVIMIDSFLRFLHDGYSFSAVSISKLSLSDKTISTLDILSAGRIIPTLIVGSLLGK